MSSQTWQDWFSRALSKYPTPWRYLFEAQEYMRPVIEATKRHCAPPATLLEAGCGIGVTAMAYAAEGYNVSGIDADEGVLRLASTLPWFVPGPLNHPIRSRDGRVVLLPGDALNDGQMRWNVAFSGGVIEHHDLPLQIAYLKALRARAPVQVVVIPSPLQLSTFPEKVQMGERPIHLSELVVRCEEAGWSVRESFGFGAPPATIQPVHESWLSFCVIGKDAP